MLSDTSIDSPSSRLSEDYYCSKSWLKINHHISVKRNPDYSAPTRTSMWFPQDGWWEDTTQTCTGVFSLRRGRRRREKKKAAAHTAPSWEACLVSLLLSPITLVWLERSLPSANYFQTQLGSGTGPRRESMRRLARLRFWLKPHCAFLSQSQHHWAYYLHGPLSNQQGLKECMSFVIENLSVWTRRF